MKAKTFTWLIGGASALVLSPCAPADFTYISGEVADYFFSNHPNAAVRDAWNAGPVNQYTIVRVYANFTSDTRADRVNAVAGTPTSPLQVLAIGGTFYNYTDFHGEHYHLPGLVPVERAWDTYVTIGNAINGGATGLSPGFATETNNLGFNSSIIGPSTNVAWFITPDAPQGQAVATAPGQAPAPGGTFRVLLAQLTVTQDTTIVFVNWLINVNGMDLPNQAFHIHIPSPAVGVTVCAAWLIAPRRRRLNDKLPRNPTGKIMRRELKG